MKKFFKKFKERFFKRVTSIEVILLIVVLAMIIIKFTSVSVQRYPSAIDKPHVGDFGPSPYENYINSQAAK